MHVLAQAQLRQHSGMVVDSTVSLTGSSQSDNNDTVKSIQSLKDIYFGNFDNGK